MAIFIICRVPNWVFIVFMMSDKPKENIHWILFFSFGLLAVVNCVLNPLLFTFLAETIRVTSYLSENFQGFFMILRKLYRKIICK
jgi:ABC-type polysaccharide/polyol phosphate export permease